MRWAFTTTRAGNWHPLTWISHMLDVQLFGPAPGGHHLVNVLLHASRRALLFALLRGLTGALWRSAVVAALFAVHPLHVESVAWVAERKDVLSTALRAAGAAGLPAATCGGPDRAATCPSRSLFALGLLAKPTLVTLPFVLLLLDCWPLGRWATAAQRRASARPGSKSSPSS